MIVNIFFLGCELVGDMRTLGHAFHIRLEQMNPIGVKHNCTILNMQVCPVNMSYILQVPWESMHVYTHLAPLLMFSPHLRTIAQIT